MLLRKKARNVSSDIRTFWHLSFSLLWLLLLLILPGHLNLRVHLRMCEILSKNEWEMENPPGWNQCGYEALSPPCARIVPREGNPRMVLSKHFGIKSHLVSMNSGRSANIPCMAVLHELKFKSELSFKATITSSACSIPSLSSVTGSHCSGSWQAVS